MPLNLHQDCSAELLNMIGPLLQSTQIQQHSSINDISAAGPNSSVQALDSVSPLGGGLSLVNSAVPVPESVPSERLSRGTEMLKTYIDHLAKLSCHKVAVTSSQRENSNDAAQMTNGNVRLRNQGGLEANSSKTVQSSQKDEDMQILPHHGEG